MINTGVYKYKTILLACRKDNGQVFTGRLCGGWADAPAAIRLAKHNHDCDNPVIPMAKLDALVLQTLVDKVVSPDRLKVMLKAMKAKIKDAQGGQNEHLLILQKELVELEPTTERLYEAVEKGLLPRMAPCRSGHKS